MRLSFSVPFLQGNAEKYERMVAEKARRAVRELAPMEWKCWPTNKDIKIYLTFYSDNLESGVFPQEKDIIINALAGVLWKSGIIVLLNSLHFELPRNGSNIKIVISILE